MKQYSVNKIHIILTAMVFSAMAAFIVVYQVENHNLKSEYSEYLVQEQKMIMLETSTIYYRVMIYENRNGRIQKPVYTECDTEEQVRQIKDFYKAVNDD